jgi:hypothetical protein
MNLYQPLLGKVSEEINGGRVRATKEKESLESGTPWISRKAEADLQIKEHLSALRYQVITPLSKSEK